RAPACSPLIQVNRCAGSAQVHPVHVDAVGPVLGAKAFASVRHDAPARAHRAGLDAVHTHVLALGDGEARLDHHHAFALVDQGGEPADTGTPANVHLAGHGRVHAAVVEAPAFGPGEQRLEFGVAPVHGVAGW